MWTSGFCVLSVIASFTVASEYEETHHNGWIPVGSDIVYSQIVRGIKQPPRYSETDDTHILNTDALNTLISEGDFNEAVEHTSDEKIFNCDNEESIEDCVNDKITKDFNVQDDRYFSPNALKEIHSYDFKTNTPVRQAKKLNKPHKISTEGFLIEHSKADMKNKLNDSESKTAESKSYDLKIDSYEVTENIIIDNEPELETASQKIGYEYNPPKRQNLTGLFKYLSKYKIEDSDNLQNYALSRRSKANIPRIITPVIKSLQFQVPVRYNSLNHLPVDPLLAVFLSNYGYYLQGQYGIRNNYNNLYGYLASNNMHNNRPFGFYKLFSDTDSSH